MASTLFLWPKTRLDVISSTFPFESSERSYLLKSVLHYRIPSFSSVTHHLSPIFWTCFLNLCLNIVVKMCDFHTLCDLPTPSQGTETNLDSWKFCMFLRTRGTAGDNTQLFLVTMLIECRRHY